MDELRTHEAAIDDWPDGIQDLYRSIGESPPASADLAGAAAVWLDGLRTVVFNAPLLHEAGLGLTDEAREELITSIAWHEYGHALSLARSTPEQRDSGERLLAQLPERMRDAIAYPGSYRRSQVFDEVIATVYTVLIARVRTHGYLVPTFLHRDVVQAFEEVIPWPPSQ